MKSKIISLVACMCFITIKQNANTEYEATANAWYERRAENSTGITASSTAIDLAISNFELAVKQTVTESSVTGLMKSYYFKGSFTSLSNDQKRTCFEEGINVGEMYMNSFPESAGIKYWQACLYGKWASVIGAVNAAKQGVAEKIKTLGEEIIAIDPEYHDAGGYEILGLVHFYSPHIPVILTWPSNQIAIENLQLAVTHSPTMANTFSYAKALLKQGNTTTAVLLLNKIKTIQPRQDKLIEDRNCLKLINDLLTEINSNK